jgi:hypothetical protein
MSDRELLELAAKAVRMVVALDYDGATWAHLVDDHPEQACRWNPLADDGEALRLAVNLGLLVSQQLSYVSVVQPHGTAAMRGVHFQEPYGTDPVAATRRAIVRAAAAIATAQEA